MLHGWKLRWTVLSLVLVALAAVPLLGDDSETAQVGWTIASYQTLSIVGSDGTDDRQVESRFVVPEPSDADLARGHVERQDALRLNAESNTPWVITARGESAHMGTSDDGSYAKPIRDLQVRAGDGTYTPLSRDNQIVASGDAGKTAVGVDYRVAFDRAEYRPGQYEATVVYTISTP